MYWLNILSGLKQVVRFSAVLETANAISIYGYIPLVEFHEYSNFQCGYAVN